MNTAELAQQALQIVMSDSISDHQQFARDTVTRFDKYLNPGFLAARKSVTEAGDEASIEWGGQGSIITDASGREFIDCLGGYGIYNFGICHPEIVAAAEKQLRRSPLNSQELLDPLRGLLAEILTSAAPAALDHAFFCNSGAEAIEAAMKLAIWNTQRVTFMSTTNSFHGKLMGSLSLMGREKYRKPFEKALMQCEFVPYGDADALEAAMAAADPKPAAFFVEPVQGEGGAIPAPDGYLTRVREICTKYGVLFVADEVQTCMGRAGTFYAVDFEGVQPDILCLGKSLGGGVMPMGAILSTDALWEVWKPNPFIHSNTFGGNPLACASAIAAVDVCLREKLPEQAMRKGERLLSEIGAMVAEFPNVLERVTGRGLLLAMHFSTNEIGYAVAAGLFHRGVLVAGTSTNATAVRIEPALNISDELLDHVLVTLRETLIAVSSAS